MLICRYYYDRDESGRPIQTVCLIAQVLNNSNHTFVKLSRGVARCNTALDSPTKTIGRNIAYGRALKAFKTEKTYITEHDFVRAEYMPELTPFEDRILRRHETKSISMEIKGIF